MENADGIKEKLVLAAVELLKSDSASITVRSIAAKAGVTQGLINYHFQSKDNLIQIATQRVIDETIRTVPDIVEKADSSPEAVLRTVMKGTLRYLTGHPAVSRISILHDWENGKSSDNMQNSINAYDAILKQIIPDEKRRFLAGHIFCAACQAFFMRSQVLLETQGIDVSDTKVQEDFVDDLVSVVLQGLNREGLSDEEK